MENDKTVYRVQGFTCTNCAGRFERNVKALPGVRDAQVNFGAAKLTVVGSATIEELERAGSFDSLRVAPEKARVEARREPFWSKHGRVLASAALLAVGWLLGEQAGEGSLPSVVAYGAAILVGGYGLFRNGLRNLFRLQFEMNTLMTIAVLGAAAIGEWGEGATVVILFAISEALERFSMDNARRSIRSLMNLAPKEALIRRNGAELSVPVEDIRVGDTMIVKPGQKLAMDGVVSKGVSTVNQAAITGESMPASKKAGDEVYAGTLNEEGLLEVRVTKTAEDTTISKIIHLVEEAQAERAPSQAFVDRFAKIYTPAILLAALLTAVAPPLAIGGDWGEWAYRGLALLVVGCPCALVISTPISIVTAIGHAARRGVLIKGGIHLEEAGRIVAVAFDKTGTLTEGKPRVTDLLVFGRLSETEALAVAAALEKRSGHPLASAILRKAEEEGVGLGSEASSFRSLTGKGVSGEIGGRSYYFGSPSLFAELHGSLEPVVAKRIADLQGEGKTVMALGTAERIEAAIAVADELRPSGGAAIRELHELGLRETAMLTGDNRAAAASIGRRLGIAEVAAELLPQQKLDAVKSLRAKYGRVAMVGDGVNDAPALAASTVGIAMGGAGTDTALETADIVLMGDDLRMIPYTMRLGRKTLAVIRQNIAFSLAIKLAALLLIVPGWLTLWMAVFADMGATLIVTLNSLRLLRMKEKAEERT
ncbi:heavy metal translocating P-type ATPase [Paenibacillus sp.]|uniref:heavy metal translocating P-type ATPase n=1 Tax=Paenibacillus sp. TaxID=58172 RepID=UPI002811C316|nr:heavy metal translocating P-type ATPase [Paenibacillus sp.]